MRTKQEFGAPLTNKARIYATCQNCGMDKETSLSSLKRTLRLKKEYICGKCRANSPEGKAKRSIQAKNMWSSDVRESLSKKLKKIANTPEGKAQRKSQSKNAWADPNYRKGHQAISRERFKSQEHKNLVSARNKEAYKSNPGKYLSDKVSALQSEKAKANHRKSVQKPEYKELHRQLAIKRFENPEYKEKIARGIEAFGREGKKSKPEETVEVLLKKLGYTYISQKAVGPYNFDFYIENIDLYIEVQGEYWHTLKNNEKRDRSKYSFFKQSLPDAKLLYIWDYDLLSPGRAENKIKEITGNPSFPVKEFNFRDLKLGEISKEEARKFLNTWHYAQFGKQPKYLFGASFEEETVAISKFGPVSRKEIAESIGGVTKNTFELDRLCIHPSYQKRNLASFFLSRATKEFWSKFPEATKLVSFADTTEGHYGTIYKASNWQCVSKVKPDYIYRNADGWVMHKKSLYNQAKSVHMKEKDYAEQHGWVKVVGKEKLKFVLIRP